MRKLAAAAALTMATVPTYAYATLTSFASYSQVAGSRSMDFVASASGPGGTLMSRAGATGNAYAATKTIFDFLVNQNSGDIGTINADYKFQATTSAYATLGTATFEQGGFSGGFSFIYSGTTSLSINGITYHTTAGTDTATDVYRAGGVNLLSGSFSNAVLAGLIGGSAGGVFDSAAALTVNNITFQSDVLTFPSNVEKDLSISLTAVNPKFTLTGGATQGDLKSFTAVSTGSFSADPEPSVNGATPELATWAMMVMGLGLIGGTIRSRKVGASIRLPVRQVEFA
jgi:hypothetical protein